MRRSLILFALPIALVGCSQDPAAPAGDANPGAATADGTTAMATEPAAPAPSPTDTSGIPEGGIPVALQGNWGMVPADCTSTRGDNKGLLRITATSLQFYESLGRLGAIRDRSDTSIKADFTFTGEGMTWNREETLSVDGNTLTRSEKGSDEPGSAGPFTYSRCAPGTGTG